MATTKVIKDLTEFNPGNPDYVLNATNAVTVSSASGSNKYYFDGVYDGKFGLRIGTTVLTGIPSGHPFTIMNNGKTSQITISGSDTVSGTAPNGDSYTFYYNTATITVLADFGTISYACSVHGYMGGLDNFVSVYSEAGLKMPTGGAFSGAPAEGMMRNDDTQDSEGSISTMQHYTGDNVWKNFVNTAQCTTATCDYPSGLSPIALYQFQDNVNNTCDAGNPATEAGSPTYATGKYGKAINLNGSSQYVNWAANNTAAINSNNFTISAWVYLDAYNSSGTQYSTIITTQANQYFYVAIAGTGLSGQGLSTGEVMVSNDQVVSGDPVSGYVTASTGVIPLTTWTHIAVTLSSGTGAKIYIGGTLDITQSGRTQNASSMSANSYIGAYNSGSSNENYFDGGIDQIRVYNSVLSDANIALLANEVGC